MSILDKEWSSLWTNDELNEWLELDPEPEALYPECPVIDAHHHLYPEGRKHNPSFDKTRFASVGRASTTSRYLRDEWEHDTRGVKVVATVYVEGRSGYDKTLKYPSVGETLFVRSVFEQNPASGLCKAIVGVIDLLAPTEEIVEAITNHQNALSGCDVRFAGVRVSLANDPRFFCVPRPDCVSEYVRGLHLIADHGLVVDIWIYHTQIPEFSQLAKASPQTTFICNHLGMPLGSDDTTFDDWRTKMKLLSTCSNVCIKLGGLGTHLCGHSSSSPIRSNGLVTRYYPWFKEAFLMFGPDRVVFESNFPVDKATCSYLALWNACKLMVKQLTKDPVVRRKLLFENANRIYGLDLPLPDLRVYEMN